MSNWFKNYPEQVCNKCMIIMDQYDEKLFYCCPVCNNKHDSLYLLMYTQEGVDKIKARTKKAKLILELAGIK